MGTYINGNFYNHASVEIDFAGKPYLGITELNYSDELERALQYGTGSVPLGVAKGQYKPNADCTMLKPEWEALKKKLPSNGFGEVPVNIGASYREASGVVIDELRTVYIQKVEESSKQGAEGNTVKITLCVVEPIRHNGSTLVKVRQRGRVAIRP